MEDRKEFEDHYCLTEMMKGDEFFFNILFERYRGRLYSYLCKVTKSAIIAEEIVLDVFLKLWTGREVAGEIKNLEAFLLKVAYHKAIDFFRVLKRNQQVQHCVWDVMADIEGEDTADQKLLADCLRAEINEAIQKMSPQRQKVFNLHSRGGLNNTEIANMMGLSPHTVKNHLHASLQFIREYLSKKDIPIVLIIFLLEKKM